MTTPSLGQTLDFIRAKHAGQVDKAGLPYWTHPVRVMLKLTPDAADDLRHAALLHDVVEDCGVALNDLRTMGYGRLTLDIVAWCTRTNRYEPYREWIERIALQAPTEVVQVKLADVMDNADPARVAKLPAKQRGMIHQYLAAAATLIARLRRDGAAGAAAPDSQAPRCVETWLEFECPKCAVDFDLHDGARVGAAHRCSNCGWEGELTGENTERLWRDQHDRLYVGEPPLKH